MDGHRYIMDAQCATAENPECKDGHFVTAPSGEVMSEEEEDMEEDKGDQLNQNERERLSSPAQSNPHKRQSSELAHWTCHSEGEIRKTHSTVINKNRFTLSFFHYFPFFSRGLGKQIIII